jgi:hypothetical protein
MANPWGWCTISIIAIAGSSNMSAICRISTPHLKRVGAGVGRALIEAVYAEADRDGCPNVYWMTQEFNETARRLYDRIATLTPFVKYSR